MKKIFTKENVMPVVVLAVICLVASALLAGVNAITAQKIADDKIAAVKESLELVMPGGDFEPVERTKDTPETVTSIYKDKNSGGHVLTLELKGYKATIAMTVGVDAEGKITKAVVTDESESHGKAGMSTYPDKFAGLDSAGVDSVEHFSGATITSTTMKGGVYDALVALGYAKPKVETLPRTDEELITLAKEIMPEAKSFKNITPDGTTLLKRLYKDTAGNGYVAYIHTYAQHGGGLESETMLAISMDGEIIVVNNIFWKVGHNLAYGPPPPPSEESVKAFFDSFVGITRDEVDSVEVITDATGTSLNVSDAVREALTAIPENNGDVPRIVGITVLALALVSVCAIVVIKAVRRRKNG